ncbi:MAG: pyrroline-5-carboxylate reductase [Planctomycetota bacterium]|jgi:pyrroline-5-carboxylate reductase
MAIRLGIIGGGTMGGSVARGAIDGGVLTAEEIVVAEPDETRRRALGGLGCQVTSEATGALEGEQVLLAVKPQVFPEVARAVAPLPHPSVVVSIMAGLDSAAIRAALGDRARVVRAMPNTPCRVGAGMTAIAIGAGAGPGDETLAVRLFESVGRTVTVAEDLMDAVTAVSGSGPAYVFLLAEAMERGAIETGLAPDVARVLVAQTIVGAGRLLDDGGAEPAALREAVTSPGGTTAAALDVLGTRGVEPAIVEAVVAARDRGAELGRG